MEIKKGKLSIDFSSIRKKIGEWDEVKIITVTDSGQGAAIYGRNGFVCHSNKALSSKLHNLNKKGKSIDDYTADEICFFADSINGLPRKILGYKTPEELFEQELDLIYAA